MNMENNTLISRELEEMKVQLDILKKKLEDNDIVNEKHIRNSMKSKMSQIQKTVRSAIIMGIFALTYCTWYFTSHGYSTAFVICTFVMLAICLALTIMQKITLNKLNLFEDNLVSTAEKINKVKKHYQNWHYIAIPTIVIWLGWVIYETINTLGLESHMAIGFCCGSLVGAIIGGIIGMRMNHKVIQNATEILSQIEELQKE